MLVFTFGVFQLGVCWDIIQPTEELVKFIKSKPPSDRLPYRRLWKWISDRSRHDVCIKPMLATRNCKQKIQKNMSSGCCKIKRQISCRHGQNVPLNAYHEIRRSGLPPTAGNGLSPSGKAGDFDSSIRWSESS